MTEHIFTELGYFTESECVAIKDCLQGYSYMCFNVSWSRYAANYTLIVRTEYETTEDELRDFFLHCALSKLLKLRQEARS
ncbi:MAG: hypothetical protein LIO60_00675 [Oscillospiraceae bacterium]|nr:hypothetical protein [Clostridiales bacterium]MCC8076860.1 hypothetical protein [Oscillospiraceae bacterium]